MKGLVKNISSVAIAGLILASGAIAADAQVVAGKLNPPQNTQKNQDVKVATQTLPIAKQVANTSPNQAKYLKLAPNVLGSEQSNLIAQTSDSDAEALRKKLRVEPLAGGTSSQKGYSPSLNFGTPSAFGANWGDAYISASAATAGKARTSIDGSISTGFGLGNSVNALGLEVGYNLGSIKNFASNGTFDLKVHRIVYSEGTNTVGVAAGWNTFAQHGNEGVANSSVYGAISTYSLLQANDTYNKMPVSFTVGVGGGQFRKAGDTIGVFAGGGLQVHPQVGLGVAWSGIGINAGVSYVPYPEIPLTFTLTGADLSNNSTGGTVLILGVGYGFNFLPK